jgi:hypothetical protein
MPSIIGISLITVFSNICAAKPLIGGVIIVLGMVVPIPDPICFWLDTSDSEPALCLLLEEEITFLLSIFLTFLVASVSLSMEKVHRSCDLHSLEDIYLKGKSSQYKCFNPWIDAISVAAIFWSGITISSYTLPMLTGHGSPAIYDWSLLVSLSLILFFRRSEAENIAWIRTLPCLFIFTSYILAQTPLRPSLATLVCVHATAWMSHVWTNTGFTEECLSDFQVTHSLCLAPMLVVMVRLPVAPPTHKHTIPIPSARPNRPRAAPACCACAPAPTLRPSPCTPTRPHPPPPSAPRARSCQSGSGGTGACACARMPSSPARPPISRASRARDIRPWPLHPPLPCRRYTPAAQRAVGARAQSARPARVLGPGGAAIPQARPSPIEVQFEDRSRGPPMRIQPPSHNQSRFAGAHRPALATAAWTGIAPPSPPSPAHRAHSVAPRRAPYLPSIVIRVIRDGVLRREHEYC